MKATYDKIFYSVIIISSLFFCVGGIFIIRTQPKIDPIKIGIICILCGIKIFLECFTHENKF